MRSELPDIVLGFVLRDGRLLAQRRRGDPGLDGVWELPGGKVNQGENHASALAREVREETGLDVNVGELVCALCHTYEDRRVALHAYACVPRVAETSGPGTPAGAQPRLAPIDAARWLAPQEYLALAIPAANPPLIEALLRTLDAPCDR